MIIYLDSGEVIPIMEALVASGAKNVLLNYYYLKRQRASDIQDILSNYHRAGIKVAIHPGSRALLSAVGKDDTDQLVKKITAHSTAYIGFVEQNLDTISTAFSTDMYKELGVQECLSMYDELRSSVSCECVLSLDQTALDELDFDSIVHNDYIALPGNLDTSTYRKYINKCIDSKTRVHGWGITKHDMVSKLPFYSVNSSSWLAGSKFGALYLYKGGATLERVIDSNASPATRTAFVSQNRVKIENEGLDPDKINSGNHYEVNTWNASQWNKYIDSMEKRLEGKAYWNKTRVNVGQLKSEALAPITSDHIVVKDRITALDYAKDPRLSVLRQCNTCIIRDSCPAFAPDEPCKLTRVNLMQSADLDDANNFIISMAVDRLMHAMAIERLEGGAITEEVSLELERVSNMISRAKKASQVKGGVTFSGQEGVSVLGALLSNLGSTSAADGRSQHPTARAASSQRKKDSLRESELDSDSIEDAEVITIDNKT